MSREWLFAIYIKKILLLDKAIVYIFRSCEVVIFSKFLIMAFFDAAKTFMKFSFRWSQKTLLVVLHIITMKRLGRVSGKGQSEHLLSHNIHHLYLFQRVGWRLWMRQQVCNNLCAYHDHPSMLLQVTSTCENNFNIWCPCPLISGCESQLRSIVKGFHVILHMIFSKEGQLHDALSYFFDYIYG